MKPVKHYPLRKLAETELAMCFSGLDDALLNDLATSLVRQWLTNDGHAGLVTSTHQCWFRLVTTGDSLEVVVSQAEGGLGRILSRDWHVDDEEIPGLLHRLNLCQSVLYRTAVGPTIRLWVEPKVRAVRCEEQAGEDE
jgi:hypothetical protein